MLKFNDKGEQVLVHYLTSANLIVQPPVLSLQMTTMRNITQELEKADMDEARTGQEILLLESLYLGGLGVRFTDMESCAHFIRATENFTKRPTVPQ
jgi:hypothetical protein